MPARMRAKSRGVTGDETGARQTRGDARAPVRITSTQSSRQLPCPPAGRSTRSVPLRGHRAQPIHVSAARQSVPEAHSRLRHRVTYRTSDSSVDHKNGRPPLWHCRQLSATAPLLSPRGGGAERGRIKHWTVVPRPDAAFCFVDGRRNRLPGLRRHARHPAAARTTCPYPSPLFREGKGSTALLRTSSVSMPSPPTAPRLVHNRPVAGRAGRVRSELN